MKILKKSHCNMPLIASALKQLAGIICLSLLCSTTLNAQFEVRGSVKASEGVPLPGVNIIEKGTSNGIISDFDGNFEIVVSDEDAVLVFSYIGFTTKEFKLNGQSDISVDLEEGSTGLDEVILIGYGSQKKSDITGSVASIDSKDFEITPLNNFSSMLQGAVAGVEVIKGSYQPGKSGIVRIRGGNSMIGSNDPLYVVDGFPSESILPNANDIESVQVLKDASATAIYGSRGANGVIIITTKRGKGEPSIKLDTYYGFQSVRNKIGLLSGDEYVQFANEKAENIGIAPYFPDPASVTVNTDWQDVIFASSAPIANYNLSITGGNADNKFAISGNYFQQDGAVRNSDYNSTNLRFNFDNKIKDWLNVSTSINLEHNKTNRIDLSGTVGLLYQTLQAPPVAPVYDDSGDYYNFALLPTADPTWRNPMVLSDRTLDEDVGNKVAANTNFSFNLLDGLVYSMRAGIVYDNLKNNYYLKQIAGRTNQARISERDSYSYLFDNILSYKNTFNDRHTLEFTTGFTWQENIASGFSAGSGNFSDDKLLTNDLSAGGIISTPTSNKEKSAIISWLGRINYFLDNKYLFTFSAREDGSSKLGENNKWGFFPSAAVAWRISEESWFDQMDNLDNLKLRISYGQTGNQNIGNYRSLSRLNSTFALQGGDEHRVIGYIPVVLQNPDLKWEVTNQFDVGLDFTIYGGALDIVFDYYVKKTTDLLATVPLSMSSGYGAILKNFGDMENKGVELTVNSKLINKPHAQLNIGFNISHNSNKVLKVATENGQFFGPTIGSPIDNFVNIIKEGEPMSSFYGYRTNGLWESDQTVGSIQPTALAGDQKYVDTNGDGTISSDDRAIIGSPFPDFTYGLTTNFNYKNFGLNLVLQGVSGGKILMVQKFTIADSFARNGNQLNEVKNHWSSQNPDPNADYPRLSNVNPLLSDRFFEDATYLRLKNIGVSYNIPTSNIRGVEQIKLYLSGENLFTITDYTGYDPEVVSNSSSNLLQSVDLGNYPSTKTISLGIITQF
ncbi:TonB-dependent receptor [Flavobacteriaceae bacterium F89]|uniref:TonB-dependent receptor n=1 Tax=Cerina litoralis TaxID=2874477 RepID=A0AAE3EXJ0_9FLAO|nr:TonB-dependent receptor [Cerina litoralis]MCG2462078.1 TonB-dependent receptor [Cerina litoralis]